MDEREQYRAILEDNLEYDILLENNPYDRDTIAEIMELLLDTICSKRQYIRIAGDDKPREVVKSQFLKLNSTHIEYVLSSFKENASKVRNIKQYLLASLWEKLVCQLVASIMRQLGSMDIQQCKVARNGLLSHPGGFWKGFDKSFTNVIGIHSRREMANQVIPDVVCEVHPIKVRCAGGIEISKICPIAFVGGIKDIGDHFGLTGTDVLINSMGRHRFL